MAYNEELLLKRYQLRDLPPHLPSGDATDNLVLQLDVKSSALTTTESTRSPTTPTTLTLDAIREEKEQSDEEDSGILPSSTFSRPSKRAQGEEEGSGGIGEPVSVSSSNNSLKEKSRMGYSLDSTQPLQEANNQHNNNIKGDGNGNGSYSFGAHNNKSSPPPPLVSSSLSSYQYQGQEQEQEQRRSQGRGGERYDGDEVRTDLDLRLLRQDKAVHQQGVSQRALPTATGTVSTRDTVTPTPPALAPRPPKSDHDILLVLHDDQQEQEQERQGDDEVKRSMHSRQGSTTLRKEMLSNVSQKVGDLDSRVNQMEALVSYKLTDIESKVSKGEERRVFDYV